MLSVQQIRGYHTICKNLYTGRKRKRDTNSSDANSIHTALAEPCYEIKKIIKLKKKRPSLMHFARSSRLLDHHVADNTSSDNEPLGSNTGRAGSTSVRSDRWRGAGRVGGTDAASASGDISHLGAVVVALTVEPVSGGGDGEGDGEGGEVGVFGDGNCGRVLDDSWGAAEGGDGRLLDGAGLGNVGGGDGEGGCGAERGGHGGRTSPGRGAGHVAMGVGAALWADGGVDASHLGGADVWHGGGRRNDRDSGAARGAARGAGRSDGRGAGRSTG